MFTQILVPIDFSEASDEALEFARTLAVRFGATLHLLHVLDTDFLCPMVGDPHAMEGNALRHLNDRFTNEDRTRGAVPVVLRSAATSDAIVGYARSAGIDLIVMGSHGRSGLSHLLRGSVTERVVRTAPCMVLTGREPLAKVA